MPATHDLGNLFVQKLDFPVIWGKKLAVIGWTQEIEYPYRYANPLIIRLPKHKAIAIGRWQGRLGEEEALERAVQKRDLADADFDEEKGWTPAPDPTGETSS